MSQDALAREAGTSQSAIARIEAGEENITLDTLGRLVGALKGRLSISIPPREKAGKPSVWWGGKNESANAWNVVNWVTMSLPDHDRALVGMVRMRQTSESSPALSTLGASSIAGTQLPSPAPSTHVLATVAGI